MNYIFYGKEHYLMQKEIQKIIEQNVTFEPTMNTSYYDALKVPMEEILADAMTLPFFSEKKVIVLNRSNFLSSETSSKYNLEILEEYFDKENDTTVLIFCLEADKLDARKKIVKKLKKYCQVKSFNDLNEHEKNDFIRQEIKKRKMYFSNEAFKEFSYRIGFSPSRIISELEKLQIYSNSIDIDSVKNLIQRSLEDDVFDFFHALIHRNMRTVFRLWNDFNALNIEPVVLIANLASQYRFLHQVKILQMNGYNRNEIISYLNAHPYRVEKTLDITYLKNEKQIQDTLNKLATLDQSIKAGLIDKKNGFELFLIQEGK